MPDLEKLARQARREKYKKWLKWGLVGLFLLIAVPFLVAAIQVMMGQGQGQPGQIPEQNRRAQMSETIVPEIEEGQGPGLSAPSQPPEIVREAARKYVREVNESNPQGIIEYWVDARANLYVLFGAGVLTIPEHRLVDFMDMQGRTWRGWVHDALTQWPRSSNFAPGVIAVDTAGKWAQNVNGKIAIFRCPQYPDVEGFRPACHIEPGEGQTVRPEEIGEAPRP